MWVIQGQDQRATTIIPPNILDSHPPLPFRMSSVEQDVSAVSPRAPPRTAASVPAEHLLRIKANLEHAPTLTPGAVTLSPSSDVRSSTVSYASVSDAPAPPWPRSSFLSESGNSTTTPSPLRKLLTLCLGNAPDKAFTVDLDSDDTVSRLRSIIAAATPHVASDIDLYAVKPGASLLVNDPRLTAFAATIRARQLGGASALGATLRVDPEEVERYLPVVWMKDSTEFVASFLANTEQAAERNRKELRLLASLDGRLEAEGSAVPFGNVAGTLPPPAYAASETGRTEHTGASASSSAGSVVSTPMSSGVHPVYSHPSTDKFVPPAEKPLPLPYVPTALSQNDPSSSGYYPVNAEDTSRPSHQDDQERKTRKRRTHVIIIVSCVVAALVIIAVIVAVVLVLKEELSLEPLLDDTFTVFDSVFMTTNINTNTTFFASVSLGAVPGKFCEIAFSSRLDSTTAGTCRKSASHNDAIHGIVTLSTSLLATVDAVVFWDLTTGITEKPSDTLSLNFTEYLPSDVNNKTMYIRSTTPAPDNGAVFVLTNLIDTDTGPYGGAVGVPVQQRGQRENPTWCRTSASNPNPRRRLVRTPPWSAVLATPTRLYVGLAGGLIVEYQRLGAAAQWSTHLRRSGRTTRMCGRLRVARKNRWLLSASHDGTVKVWDLDAMPKGDLAGDGAVQMPVAKYALMGAQGPVVDELVEVGIHEDETEIAFGGTNKTTFFVHRLPQRGEVISSDSLRWSAKIGYPTWNALHYPGQKPWLVYGGTSKKPQLWQQEG
ncbi:hypothetical protein HDU96_008275 [Phlyctochytrium bullatum]|nr:hypothetical protein HDU96_008275 [Phlyctochytrium bullatum]